MSNLGHAGFLTQCAEGRSGRPTFRAATIASVPVVFINGLGETTDFWDPVCARLPDVDVVRFDRPAPAGLGNHLDAQVDELHSMITSHAYPPAEGADVLLVGHSFGGLLAEAYARAHPRRVAGLVLVDPTLAEDYADPDAADRRAPAAGGAFGRLASRTLRSGRIRPALSWLLPRLMLGLGTSGDSVRHQLAQLPADLGWKLTAPSHLARTEFDNRRLSGYCAELLAARAATGPVTLPVTVLVGGRGPRVWHNQQRAWIAGQRAQLPRISSDACMHVLDGAHLLMLDAPTAVADAIRAVAGACLRPQK